MMIVISGVALLCNFCVAAFVVTLINNPFPSNPMHFTNSFVLIITSIAGQLVAFVSENKRSLKKVKGDVDLAKQFKMQLHILFSFQNMIVFIEYVTVDTKLNVGVGRHKPCSLCCTRYIKWIK